MGCPTHIFIVLLLLFIVIRYYSTASDNCPCSFHSNAFSADCSGWNRPLKLLQRIPGSNCIPDTTRRLDLSFNNITYQSGQFQRFSHLTYLDLSVNVHFIPSNDSFSGLTHLRTLFLNNTKLTELQTSLFAHRTRLETLSLSHNDLSYLSSQLFSNLTNLTYLDLSSCTLTAIENSPFISLHSLQYLDLSWNKQLLHSQTFFGLFNLEELHLSNSYIQTLPTGVFDHLTNLRKLDLEGCILFEIENHLFFSLTNLRSLNLGGNYLNMYSNSFAGLSKLSVLSLVTTAINSSFPQDVFHPLINLETIHLEGICSNPRGSYDCENIDEHLSVLPSLKKLYIDIIVLDTLQEGFLSLTKLETLSLNRTGEPYCIDTLSNETFKNLENSPISTLVLEEITIGKILPYTFSIFRTIHSVELFPLICKDYYSYWQDHIETGLENAGVIDLRLGLKCPALLYSYLIRLTGLTSTPLETLDLSGGFVRSIQTTFFVNLPTCLKYLYLEHNYIFYVEFDDLHRLKGLLILSLRNQKSILDDVNNTQEAFTGQSLNITSLVSATTKMFLYAKSAANSIPGLDQNTCHKLPASLVKLDISNSGLLCDITVILCNTDNALLTLNIADQSQLRCLDDIWNLLKNLPKLKTLDMSGNHIKSIPADSLSNLKRLEKLTLARNALGPVVSFELQSFVLENLILSDNSIGYLTQAFTEKIEKIGKESNFTLYLNNNNLLCDCDRIYFVDWLQRTKHIYEKESLVCAPHPNKNYSVNNIAELYESLKYSCTMKEVVIGCIVLFVGLQLILYIVYLIWYKRWKIRYLLAVGKKTVNPYHPIEDCEIELEYDVYISYERDYDVTRSQTLHEFVSQALYPELQRRGYKVLIREDLEPGVGLYKSISFVLRRCKKVVSLVSRDYCRDYWNVFEFNMAVLEGIYTKRQVLIPVAFEQIGREDLHDEIYAFLKAGSVAYHSDNVTDEMLVDYLCDKINDNTEFGE